MSHSEAIDEALPIDLRLSEDELKRHHEHITEFIRETIAEAGADGAVLGLSGGIDSTLTAYLASEALGPDRLRGVVMPSEVNDEENMSALQFIDLRVCSARGLQRARVVESGVSWALTSTKFILERHV